MEKSMASASGHPHVWRRVTSAVNLSYDENLSSSINHDGLIHSASMPNIIPPSPTSAKSSLLMHEFPPSFSASSNNSSSAFSSALPSQSFSSSSVPASSLPLPSPSSQSRHDLPFSHVPLFDPSLLAPPVSSSIPSTPILLLASSTSSSASKRPSPITHTLSLIGKSAYKLYFVSTLLVASLLWFTLFTSFTYQLIETLFIPRMALLTDLKFSIFPLIATLLCLSTFLLDFGSDFIASHVRVILKICNESIHENWSLARTRFSLLVLSIPFSLSLLYFLHYTPSTTLPSAMAAAVLMSPSLLLSALYFSSIIWAFIKFFSNNNNHNSSHQLSSFEQYLVLVGLAPPASDSTGFPTLASSSSASSSPSAENATLLFHPNDIPQQQQQQAERDMESGIAMSSNLEQTRQQLKNSLAGSHNTKDTILSVVITIIVSIESIFFFKSIKPIVALLILEGIPFFLFSSDAGKRFFKSRLSPPPLNASPIINMSAPVSSSSLSSANSSLPWIRRALAFFKSRSKTSILITFSVLFAVFRYANQLSLCVMVLATASLISAPRFTRPLLFLYNTVYIQFLRTYLFDLLRSRFCFRALICLCLALFTPFRYFTLFIALFMIWIARRTYFRHTAPSSSSSSFSSSNFSDWIDSVVPICFFLVIVIGFYGAGSRTIESFATKADVLLSSSPVSSVDEPLPSAVDPLPLFPNTDSYAICNLKVNNLTMVEYAMLSAMSYLPSKESVQTSLDSFFGAKRLRVTNFDPYRGRRDSIAGIEVTNSESGQQYVAIRGPVDHAEFMQDLAIWQGPALLSLIDPSSFGLIPAALSNRLIQAMYSFGSVFVVPTLERDLYSDLDRLYGPFRLANQLAFTGHGFGGGFASLMSAKLKVPAVTFNAPGTQMVAPKLGIDSNLISKFTVSIKSQLDWIASQVDPLGSGLTQHITCSNGKSCPSITSILCELSRSCGDVEGRRIAICEGS